MFLHTQHDLHTLIYFIYMSINVKEFATLLAMGVVAIRATKGVGAVRAAKGVVKGEIVPLEDHM